MNTGAAKPGDRVYAWDAMRPKWRGWAKVESVREDGDGVDATMERTPSEIGCVLLWWSEIFHSEEDFLRSVILEAAGVKGQP